MRIILGIIITVALAWGHAPSAHARDANANGIDDVPRVDFTHQPVMVLEGPNDIWGMRRVAAQLDKKIDEIRILRRKGITCADRPRAACVTVRFVHLPRAGWDGQALITEVRVDDRWVITDMEIQLNSASRHRGVPKQFYACHEFLHTWGLDHHEASGCVGYKDQNDALSNSDWPVWASAIEMRKIRKAYAK